MIALGGFIMGFPFYLAVSDFLNYRNHALLGFFVALGAGYVAVKTTSPGTWALPTKNEKGKALIIETENRIPLLQEEVKIYEASNSDNKETRKVIDISVNNNMIYITLGSSGIYKSETYKISSFDISS